MEAGETVSFTVSGVADGSKGDLEMNITALIMPGKEGVAPLQETRIIQAPGDEFTETFSFIVPTPTKEFNVKAQISRNGNLIEEKTNAYVARKESASTLIDIPQKIVEKYGDGGFELWMILIFTLAVIVLLIALLHKKKRFNILFLLLLPFAGISVASASPVVDWEYPVTNEYFNSTSTTGFEVVVFRGNITDSVTGVGYFQSNSLTSMKAEFKNAGSTIFTKIVPIEDVHITDGEDYWFDVNLSDAEFTALGEGSLQVQLTINGAITTGWAGLINIDETAPVIVFTYTPDEYTNESIESSISCMDDGGAGCLQEGISAYAPFEFTVEGNFSDIFENGMRGFEVCDKVGNCTSKDVTKLSIDFYDPVDPELNTGVTVERAGLPPLDGSGDFEDNVMAAYDTVILSILGVIDPDDNNTYTQDDNACGRDGDDDTYLATVSHFDGSTTYNRCTPKWFVCAVNHPVEGVADPRRDEMKYDDDPICSERGTVDIPTECGFTYTFPFTLNPCD